MATETTERDKCADLLDYVSMTRERRVVVFIDKEAALKRAYLETSNTYIPKDLPPAPP